MLHYSVLLSSFLTLSAAHFHLHFPAARGDDDEEQASFPCGGYAQTQNRTAVALDSIPISMELGHTENLITVVLAIGNDVGDSFNTVLVPTIQEFGPGDFCWASIPVPANLSIMDGTNGTIQVITNSHDGNGLYNCADITFSSTTAQSQSSCTNGTGISASPLAANEYVLANASASHGEGHGGESPSASGSSAAETGSATASGAASATQSDGANMMAVGWGILGAGVLGAVAIM